MTHIVNDPRPGLNTAACGRKVLLAEEQLSAYEENGHSWECDCPDCSYLDGGETDEDELDEDA